MASQAYRGGRVNVANRLTVTRILLTPFFVASLVYYASERVLLYWFGIVVVVLACVSDAADGYWATKMGQKTRLGSYIDPIADKLLLLSGYICLGFIRHLPEAMQVPAWLSILVISRDIVILLGATMIYVLTGTLNAKPLFVGKLTTVLQMMTVFVSLLMLPGLFRIISCAVTGIFTVLSGLLYVRMGGQILQENGK